MIYLLVNTSTPECEFVVYKDESLTVYKWEAGRSLARDILSYIEEILSKSDCSFWDIGGVAVFEGPGSFTGLRIGITVMNTLADSLVIPIVGVRGDDWINDGIYKLNNGIDQKIVLPFYGSEANITVSKK